MTDATKAPEPLTPDEFVTALLSTVEKEVLADGVDA
jgi:hypothetical protein